MDPCAHDTPILQGDPGVGTYRTAHSLPIHCCTLTVGSGCVVNLMRKPRDLSERPTSVLSQAHFAKYVVKLSDRVLKIVTHFFCVTQLCYEQKIALRHCASRHVKGLRIEAIRTERRYPQAWRMGRLALCEIRIFLFEMWADQLPHRPSALTEG